MDTFSSIFQIISHITLIYNMFIYFRWPSRASTRSPTTSPTISSRSRPSFRDQRLRLMYKKKGRCFKKPFDATLWPVWQRIPQANDNQTSSKRPLQYRSPPHTATRNQILQNTKRTKKTEKNLTRQCLMKIFNSCYWPPVQHIVAKIVLQEPLFLV